MALPPANVAVVVEVIGSDVFGQQFFENGQTLSVYPDGLSIRLKTKLARDSEVIVRNPETSVETVASVLSQIRDEANGQVYALLFANPPEGLWRSAVAFAPSARVSVECGVCHTASSFSLSGVALEAFEATRELSHACEKCKSSRIWREAKEVGVTPVAPSIPVAGPDSPAIEPPIEERRKFKRTPMKAPACIRYAGMEVVVACEDVSKGGFRFLSSKEFPEGTRVEAAVPYTKFSNNIFSHAVVAYCRRLPDGQFRHGMAYAKTSSSLPWDPQEELR